MEWKKIVIGIILVIFLMIVYFPIHYYENQNTEKYLIITYDRFLTLMNDGGTHTNTKYEIDFTKKSVIKLQDYYKGFEGLQYENKVLYQKKLTEQETKSLKELLDDIIKNKEQYANDKNKTYVYYTVQKNDLEEMKVYDRNVIDQLENLLKRS